VQADIRLILLSLRKSAKNAARQSLTHAQFQLEQDASQLSAHRRELGRLRSIVADADLQERLVQLDGALTTGKRDLDLYRSKLETADYATLLDISVQSTALASSCSARLLALSESIQRAIANAVWHGNVMLFLGLLLIGTILLFFLWVFR
jgi:hypothetical protein